MRDGGRSLLETLGTVTRAYAHMLSNKRYTLIQMIVVSYQNLRILEKNTQRDSSCNWEEALT